MSVLIKSIETVCEGDEGIITNLRRHIHDRWLDQKRKQIVPQLKGQGKPCNNHRNGIHNTVVILS